MDPPHVRGGRPAQAGARRRQGLRLHPGQSRDRAAARRCWRRRGACSTAPSPTCTPTCPTPATRRVREAVAKRLARGHGAAVHGQSRPHDGGRRGRAEHRAEGPPQPRGRGHHGGAVLRRVRLLRREPRRPAGRGAADGRPHCPTSAKIEAAITPADARASSSTRRTIRAASSIPPRRSRRSRRARPRRPAHRAHQRRALQGPRLRRRGAARGAAARDPLHRRHVVVQGAGHPRRAHRLSRLLPAHGRGRRAVRGVHVHRPRARLRERARALAVGGGRGGRPGDRRGARTGRSAT